MAKITMAGNYFNVDKLKELGEQVYTITKCVPDENVAPEDQKPEIKPVVYFNETTTGAVLNQTRLAQLTEIFGSNDDDDWKGKKVIIYVDPDVKMGNKKTGGVAFKAYQEESKLFPKGMKV